MVCEFEGGVRGVMHKWIRTTMNNLALVEGGQAVKDTFGNLAQYLLANAAAELFDFLINAVQAAPFAVLHRNGYDPRQRVSICAVVFADVFSCYFPVEVELAPDLLLDVRIRIRRNDL